MPKAKKRPRNAVARGAGMESRPRSVLLVKSFHVTRQQLPVMHHVNAVRELIDDSVRAFFQFADVVAIIFGHLATRAGNGSQLLGNA